MNEENRKYIWKHIQTGILLNKLQNPKHPYGRNYAHVALKVKTGLAKAIKIYQMMI